MTEKADTRQYHIGDDTRVLRDAFGCFATGVTIVTARGPGGERVGLTVNSFTSVSLDPPLLLVCPARSSASAGVLESAGHFAVNVLGDDAHEISALFARPTDDRFTHDGWHDGPLGAPVLAGALASFECRRHAVHDGGDHLMLVGEVQSARFQRGEAPLLYFRGAYHRLHFD